MRKVDEEVWREDRSRGIGNFPSGKFPIESTLIEHVGFDSALPLLM